MEYFAAIDIGASSGRHIVGWVEEGEINTREVFRFSNGIKKENGHLIWDLEHLVSCVKQGMEKVCSLYPVRSLAIDTWGVDYVLLKDGREISPCYAYRDSRTLDVTGRVHGIVPFEELYHRTGCQFQSFNTVYQLYCDKVSGRLDEADELLMIPEYLAWKLCGKMVREYTNATTTGLVNAEDGEYDPDLLDRLGFPKRLFPALTRPGKVIGTWQGIDVVLAATHDTASAVEGIPMQGKEIYLSSGTWSLMGVKAETPFTDEGSRRANFSNEGGVGYIRYQKNIMGMWVINELKRELCPDRGFEEIIAEAENSGFCETVDINDPRFLAPESMKAVFDRMLSGKPETIGDYFRAAFCSLARSYGETVREIEQNTGKTYHEIYIVGGGAKNVFLNRLTELETKKKVTALPMEATAFGNLKIQMESAGITVHGVKEEGK